MKYCPTCGKQGLISDSRKYPQYTRRSYVCKEGHRWGTIEELAVIGKGTSGKRYVSFRLDTIKEDR